MQIYVCLEKQDAYIEFKNYNNKFPCPFVIYCDFEALIQQSENIDDCENIENIENIEDCKHNHMPCGFAFHTISRIPEYNNFEPIIYRGETTVKILLLNY